MTKWDGKFFDQGKATVLVGGQAGSEGKGCFVGFLTRNYHFDASICQFMANAGHTAFGKVVKQVPMASAVRQDTLFGGEQSYLIGPGSAIDLDILFAEIQEFGLTPDRLMVHPRAMIIEQRHKDIEAEVTKRVASTMKGCGAAWADRALRHPSVRLAQDVPELAEFIMDTSHDANVTLATGGTVLVEGSQGFDLDPYHGLQYPYCTSRSISASAVVADVGIAPSRVGKVFAVIRTFPIRVGNVVENGEQVGYSGDYASDNRETSFEEIFLNAGYRAEEIKAEYTTVTKRMRRIFTFSYERYEYMLTINNPDGVMVSFIDYLDKRNVGATIAEDLTMATQHWLNDLEETYSVPVVAISTGPDMVMTRPEGGWLAGRSRWVDTPVPAEIGGQ